MDVEIKYFRNYEEYRLALDHLSKRALVDLMRFNYRESHEQKRKIYELKRKTYELKGKPC